jgi:DNA-directed RNA polymerase specialized sigma24 family protein
MAEDLVQEAMLQAARYIPHGTIHDLNGYLILCVKEIWWMRATQLRRRPETEPFDPHGMYRGQFGFVENDVTERETIQEVITLFDCLPDDERDVAMLKVIYGYDISGAADVLGRGRSGVGAAWRRCTRRFTAWAGTKQHYDALDQALILARYPDSTPVENCCKVSGCARPRHAYERCEYHAEGMLARRRQLAEKRD